MSAEIRDDAPDGPVARALFAEYMELVRERLGLPEDFTPPRHIFASEDVFSGDGGAWLVVLDAGGQPIGCGGLRMVEPGIGEIKRMFVAARARGAGHGRRLLRELERRAAEAGMHSVRLLTTEVLNEGARALRRRGLSRDRARPAARGAARDLAREGAHS